MVDFIHEVEEELRKDSYNELLRKFGPWIIGACVLIVAATGAYEYFKTADARAAKAASISYVEAAKMVEDGDRDAAIARYVAIGQKAKPGYAGLSLMQAAALKLEDGERAEALRLFDQAAQTFDTDLHKQLANLKAAYILADDGRYDDVNQRLTGLAESGQPFEYLARELKGFVALAQDDVKSAKSEFSYLARSPDVSEGIRNRAEQVLALTPSLAVAPIPAETPTDIDAPTPAEPSEDMPTEPKPETPTQEDAE